VTFATTKQIIAMTLLWAAVMFGIDYAKNPRPAGMMFASRMGESTHGEKPRIKLWMNHLCCSGCLSDVSAALAGISGIKVLDVVLRSKEEADPIAGKAPDLGNEVELEVSNLQGVNFMAIDRALRDAGLVANRMEFSGPRHYRLQAELAHICCGLCSTGLKDGLEITKGLRAQKHDLQWLDSFDVVKEKKLVVAHARYDAVADVTELIGALNQLGFQPSSIFAVDDPESMPAATGKR
jgi:copper chaperone CopZ